MKEYDVVRMRWLTCLLYLIAFQFLLIAIEFLIDIVIRGYSLDTVALIAMSTSFMITCCVVWVVHSDVYVRLRKRMLIKIKELYKALFFMYPMIFAGLIVVYYPSFPLDRILKHFSTYYYEILDVSCAISSLIMFMLWHREVLRLARQASGS